MTEEEIDKAIKKCEWKDNQGFDVCRGMCLPCQRVIERGQCETLIELFRKERSEDE